MNMIEATHLCRKARPDLPMVGAVVDSGEFHICYFPDWGKTDAPEPEYIAEGLGRFGATEALLELAGDYKAIDALYNHKAASE